MSNTVQDRPQTMPEDFSESEQQAAFREESQRQVLEALDFDTEELVIERVTQDVPQSQEVTDHEMHMAARAEVQSASTIEPEKETITGEAAATALNLIGKLMERIWDDAESL